MPPLAGMPYNPNQPPTIDPDVISRLLQSGGDWQTLLQGDPSQAQPAASATTPTTAPPSGTLAQNMPPTPSSPSTMPSAPPVAASAPQASQTPPSGAVSQSLYGNSGDYNSANPDAYKAYMPPRPVGPWDGPHGTLRSVLGSLFAGMSEYAGEKVGRPGQGANMIGRWNEENNAQRQYDTAAPQLQARAKNEAFGEYQGEQQRGAQTGLTEAEAGKARATTGTMFLPAQQKVLDQVRADVNAGKMSNHDIFNAHLQDLVTTPGLTRSMLVDAINNAKPLGPNYSVVKGEGARPEGLQDRTGKQYGPNEIPSDPEAQTEWQNAQAGHAQGRAEKMADEKTVAGYAADRQAQAFSNQQTEQGRKAASTSLNDINDAKNQQSMIENLLGGKMNPTSQTAAMFKMIGLEQPTGAHRIMPAEIEGIEQQGGLTDRLKQKLLNWKEGDRFDPDLVPDVVSTAKTLSQNKIKTANDNLESTARIYGYKAPGSDAKGRFDKPTDYAQPQANAGQGGGAPKIAVGQQVTIKGKSMKVTAVHPDGSFDAQ